MPTSNSDLDVKTIILIVTTAVVLAVCVLGICLFARRSRVQGRWAIEARAHREWVQKMDELGIALQTPALHEVVVWESKADVARFNEETWSEFMVCTSDRNASE
jgi:hypothetical protein